MADINVTGSGAGTLKPPAAKTTFRSNLEYLDLDSPVNYLQSAYDIANHNNLTSEAMAREQMAFQERANAKAMDFSATEAQKTRDWQTMMSDTAHQREVRDLIAAGLNPLLSANQGAAVGSASSAQGVTSSGAKGNVDTGAVNALTQAYVQAKQIEMQEKSLAIQDKNIEAQLIMNGLNNETTKYAADKGAAASMYSSGLMSSANRYAAELAKQASAYAADLNYQLYEEGFHNNWGQLLNFIEYWIDDHKDTPALTVEKPSGKGPHMTDIDPGDFSKAIQNIFNNMFNNANAAKMNN